MLQLISWPDFESTLQLASLSSLVERLLNFCRPIFPTEYGVILFYSTAQLSEFSLNISSFLSNLFVPLIHIIECQHQRIVLEFHYLCSTDADNSKWPFT